MDVSSADFRQTQQIIDHLRHALCRAAHDIEVPTAAVAQLLSLVFEEERTESVDGTERRAQIMRHGVRKCLKFLVGLGKLGGTLDDAPFEIAACRFESAIAISVLLLAAILTDSKPPPQPSSGPQVTAAAQR